MVVHHSHQFCYSGAKVHKGFYTAWKAIKTSVTTSVQAAIAKNPTATQFVIVGHSLGGALATFAGLEFTGVFAGLSSMFNTILCS